MKTEIPGIIVSILASADLVKNRFMGVDGNYCGANAKALGVSQTDTTTGQQCPVVIGGIKLVESGGVITAGVQVASDANGKAVAATAFSVAVPAGATAVTSDAAQPNLTEAGGVLPQALNGQALDAASGAGEFIRVKLY